MAILGSGLRLLILLDDAYTYDRIIETCPIVCVIKMGLFTYIIYDTGKGFLIENKETGRRLFHALTARVVSVSVFDENRFIVITAGDMFMYNTDGSFEDCHKFFKVFYPTDMISVSRTCFATAQAVYITKTAEVFMESPGGSIKQILQYKDKAGEDRLYCLTTTGIFYLLGEEREWRLITEVDKVDQIAMLDGKMYGIVYGLVVRINTAVPDVSCILRISSLKIKHIYGSEDDKKLHGNTEKTYYVWNME